MYKKPEEDVVFLLATSLPHPFQSMHYSTRIHKWMINFGDPCYCWITQDRPIVITQESDISMELDGARATSSWFVIKLYILRLYDIA
jgi:hypothetical protein